MTADDNEHLTLQFYVSATTMPWTGCYKTQLLCISMTNAKLSCDISHEIANHIKT